VIARNELPVREGSAAAGVAGCAIAARDDATGGARREVQLIGYRVIRAHGKIRRGHFQDSFEENRRLATGAQTTTHSGFVRREFDAARAPLSRDEGFAVARGSALPHPERENPAAFP
jgi:hypothetical protein